MDRKMRSAFYFFGLISCVDCSVQGVVIRGCASGTDALNII